MNVKKFLLLIMLFPAMGFAELRLPTVLSNSMVLQQKSDVKIWGWADANATIEIKASWMCFGKIVTADGDGNWLTSIKTPEASNDSYDIFVMSGKDAVRIKDVLIGEVWLASGQSNMGFPLYATENANEAVHSADYPQIRFFRVPINTTDQLHVNTKGKWEICKPKAASGFSGAAYYFAKDLHEKLNVPVGVIQSAVGGTPIEAWMDRETLAEESPTVVDAYDKFALKWVNGEKEKYYKQLAEYNDQVKEAQSNDTEKPTKPSVPFGPEHFQHPCGLYNGMIHPLINYTIKGFIWYQGEGNAWRAKDYMNLFPAMVKSWRHRWQGDLPFYFVQIAPCTYYDEHSQGMENICAELQEAQRLSLNNMPNSGMVVPLDTVSDYDDIHPKNKKDIGQRLAKLALNKTYNHKIVSSGPLYKKMKIEGDSIRLYFTHTDGGLVIKQAEKNGFEIAGSDGQYCSAEVQIQSDSLVLSSVEVPDPTAARYGWNNTFKPTLFNGKGFPASCFRTDNSEWETAGKLIYF